MQQLIPRTVLLLQNCCNDAIFVGTEITFIEKIPRTIEWTPARHKQEGALLSLHSCRPIPPLTRSPAPHICRPSSAPRSVLDRDINPSHVALTSLSAPKFLLLPSLIFPVGSFPESLCPRSLLPFCKSFFWPCDIIPSDSSLTPGAAIKPSRWSKQVGITSNSAIQRSIAHSSSRPRCLWWHWPGMSTES